MPLVFVWRLGSCGCWGQKEQWIICHVTLTRTIMFFISSFTLYCMSFKLLSVITFAGWACCHHVACPPESGPLSTAPSSHLFVFSGSIRLERHLAWLLTHNDPSLYPVYFISIMDLWWNIRSKAPFLCLTELRVGSKRSHGLMSL